MRALAGFALLLLLLAPPAVASETPWQEVAPDVRVRLIASNQLRPDGTTLAALEVDMPMSTKTYWRVPGETGIATEVDLAGSVGVGWNEIVWPYPMLETKSGYTDFVYYGRTVLPIELKVSTEQPLIRAGVIMGVCSEICVPVQASFDLELDFAAPDKGNGLRISQALATAPLGWEDPREPIGDVSFDPAAGLLTVPVSGDELDPLSLIAAADDGDLLFGAPQKSPDGKLVQIPLLGGNGAGGLVGRTIRLTFMTPMGPFELSRRVKPST